MHIRSDFIRSTVVVYSNYAAKCFTVSGSNTTGGIIFGIRFKFQASDIYNIT